MCSITKVVLIAVVLSIGFASFFALKDKLTFVNDAWNSVKSFFNSDEIKQLNENVVKIGETVEKLHGSVSVKLF